MELALLILVGLVIFDISRIVTIIHILFKVTYVT
jgi:hypothetical protein